MWKDEIVEEVRKVRDDYAAKFNYDLDAIYEDIKKQEKKTRRQVVSLYHRQGSGSDRPGHALRRNLWRRSRRREPTA